MEHHGLDSDTRVCFYEQDFYVLSNFSSFSINMGLIFPTAEHYYHYLKFQLPGEFVEDDVELKARYELASQISQMIIDAPSAHAAFQIAQLFKQHRRPDWDEVKYEEMRFVLTRKLEQHEYVRRKLLETGDRELVENSWRDDVWGWGPNQDGQNLLGKLWMELRTELKEGTLFVSKEVTEVVAKPQPTNGGILSTLRWLRRTVEETGIHHSTPSVREAFDQATVVLGRGY